MKGTIRFFIGFILVMGGVGGIENNIEMLPSLWYAVAGLALMGWAVYDINKMENAK